MEFLKSNILRSVKVKKKTALTRCIQINILYMIWNIFTLYVYTCYSRSLHPFIVGVNVLHITFIMSVILTLNFTDVKNCPGRALAKCNTVGSGLHFRIVIHDPRRKIRVYLSVIIFRFIFLAPANSSDKFVDLLFKWTV